MGLQDRDFKGVWIPKEIWLNNELSVLEKALFAEIDSLDGEDGCYASNDYFMEFFNVSESTITRGISKLKSLGYIDSVQIGGRSRVLRVVKMTTQGSQNDYSGSSKNCVSSIKEKKENNIIDKSTGAGASSKNHSQVYKQRTTLSDDLESGKDIDEQKKFKKQSPKDKFRDECLDIIEKQFVMYPAHISDLLADYFDFVSAVPDDKENLPKRVKTVSTWKKKLHKLVELVSEGYDIEKLIQQSLDNKAYVFYPLQSTQSQHKSKENLSDTIKVNTQEGVQRQIEYLRASGKELY